MPDQDSQGDLGAIHKTTRGGAPEYLSVSFGSMLVLVQPKLIFLILFFGTASEPMNQLFAQLYLGV